MRSPRAGSLQAVLYALAAGLIKCRRDLGHQGLDVRPVIPANAQLHSTPTADLVREVHDVVSLFGRARDLHAEHQPMETFGRAAALVEELYDSAVEADDHLAKNQVSKSSLAHEISVAGL